MTDSERNEDIIEARIRREEAKAALQDIREHRKTVEPVWRRVIGRKVQNGFGEDYDLSLVPVTERKAS